MSFWDNLHNRSWEDGRKAPLRTQHKEIEFWFSVSYYLDKAMVRRILISRDLLVFEAHFYRPIVTTSWWHLQSNNFSFLQFVSRRHANSRSGMTAL